MQLRSSSTYGATDGEQAPRASDEQPTSSPRTRRSRATLRPARSPLKPPRQRYSRSGIAVSPSWRGLDEEIGLVADPSGISNASSSAQDPATRVSKPSPKSKGKKALRVDKKSGPALTRELKGLGFLKESYSTKDDTDPDLTEEPGSGGFGRATRAILKMTTDELAGFAEGGPSTPATGLLPSSKLRPGILLRHGLSTPLTSTPDNESVFGSTRLRRVSFANPLVTPPPTSIASTSVESIQYGPVTRSQKRKLFATSDASQHSKRTSITKQAKETVECAICAYRKPKQGNFPLVGHFPQCTTHEPETCIACITTHTMTILEAKGTWDAVTCPQCNAKLDGKLVRQVLSRKDSAAASRTIAKKTLVTNPNYTWCAWPDCSAGTLYKAPRPFIAPTPQNPWPPRPHWDFDPNNVSNQINMVKCRKCKRSTCFRHKIVWHENYSCERYDDSHPAAAIVRTNEERLDKMTKRCPGAGCGKRVEKDGGCNHMFCTQCQTSWNWESVKWTGEVAPSSAATAAGAVMA